MRELTVPDVLPLVLAYRDEPGNDTGGSLHITLDDGNVLDNHVMSCLTHARERGDDHGVLLADLLRQMSRTQRKKLSAQFYTGQRADDRPFMDIYAELTA